ncbi:MAG: hypothetical protein QM783_03225 [Phycisphaerales bacterium]
MLPILLISCALAQPTAPATATAPATPAQPEAPAAKTEPTPLDQAAAKGLTDRLLGRGPGSYLTAKRMLEWAAEANPADAEAAKKTWAQWETETGPGFEAILQEFGRRLHSTRDEAYAVFTKEFEKSLESLKPKMTPEVLHAVVARNTLAVRDQPAATVSYLYMFDPARAGDDMKLVAAGKTRKVKARLNGTGGPESVLEFSVPLSWNVVIDNPESFCIAENGGLGPLMVTVNAFKLPKDAEHDPVKFAARLAGSSKEHGEPIAGTLAGRPSGRMWTRVVKPAGQEIVCGRYDYHAVIGGDRVTSVAVAVATTLTAQQREYTVAELAAYAESHKGVIDWIVGTCAFADAPTEAPKATPAK